MTNQKNKPILIYVTFPDVDSAKRISTLLLKSRLIGCANIVANISSYYNDEGELQESHDFAVHFKTLYEKYSQIEKVILTEHPYDCPCIMSWPIEDINKDFHNWLIEQTL